MDTFSHSLPILILWNVSVVPWLEIAARTESCQHYKVSKNVTFNISDCFSYETYKILRPSHTCVDKCRSTLGCVAVGCDSMFMTSMCCTLVNTKIALYEGNSTIIHHSDRTVCKGSDWSGAYSTNTNSRVRNFIMSFQFEGIGFNCSHFTGERISEFYVQTKQCCCCCVLECSLNVSLWPLVLFVTGD